MPQTLQPTYARGCEISRRAERLGHAGAPLISVIHVPKSAGTSARSLFQDWMRFLPPSNRVPITMSNMQETCEHGAPNASKLSGVHIGHTGWGVGDGAPEKRFNLILMREPKSRFLSLINYLKQERRAPKEWTTEPFAKALEQYRNVRLTNPSVLDTNQTSMSNQIIHHALLDQLSLLATYKCVSPTPDVNPYKCVRPKYVFDEPANSPSSALCSVSNMKRLAMENIQKADAIVMKDDLDDLVNQGRFHFDFVPSYSRPRRMNVARSYIARQLVLGDRENKWLDEWFATETEIYTAALQISRTKSAIAKSCIPNPIVPLAPRPVDFTPRVVVPPKTMTTSQGLAVRYSNQVSVGAGWIGRLRRRR